MCRAFLFTRTYNKTLRHCHKEQTQKRKVTGKESLPTVALGEVAVKNGEISNFQKKANSVHYVFVRFWKIIASEIGPQFLSIFARWKTKKNLNSSSRKVRGVGMSARWQFSFFLAPCFLFIVWSVCFLNKRQTRTCLDMLRTS